MALKLYYHPLSSFCWKALIPLYENRTAFEPVLVDFGDEASAAALAAVWPIRKFPVVEDTETGAVVAEATLIAEWLDLHRPGPVRFVPEEASAALEVRTWDRIVDHYVHYDMQKVMTDPLRPEGARDPFGVAKARAEMQVAYDLLERRLAGREFLAGDGFSLADCAAAPALFYGRMAQPFGDRPALTAYLERLKARPAFARVLAEAEPYFSMVPQPD